MKKPKINNGNYSPVKGRFPNNEDVLNGNVKSYYKDKTELEAMLAREYGRKLEPVKAK